MYCNIINSSLFNPLEYYINILNSVISVFCHVMTHAFPMFNIILYEKTLFGFAPHWQELEIQQGYI